MTTTNQPLAPLKPKDRIQSLDVMRGVVLLGILIMNINGMGLARAYADPTVSGGHTGWDLITWITANMFFEGTMRALFSLLFGVGMYILLDRLEKKGAGIDAANIYFRRLLWLLIFGLIHAYLLLWIGEILYNYALMGFLVFSFRSISPKKLIEIAVFLIVAGTTWDYFSIKSDIEFADQVEIANQYKTENKVLTEELKEASEKWEAMLQKRTPESIIEFNENMRKDYFSVVAFLAPISTKFNEHDPYRYDLWDVLSMMLIGIALFKLNILSAEKSFKFYIIMALICYAVGLSINYHETKLILDNNFSYSAFNKSFYTYQLGRIPTSLGHVALIMIFCKLPVLNWLKSSLSAVGKMALTNYVMHSVFAMFIFTGAGLGLFGTFTRHELMYIVFSIWIFQLITSPIWLKYYQFGPLEWVWRNLSYLKRYPIKK